MLNPSAVMSISFPSAPIWIDPSEFFVKIAWPSIFNPSATTSTSFPSAPIWTEPSLLFFTKVVLLVPPVLIPSSSILKSSSVPDPPSEMNLVSVAPQEALVVLHFLSARFSIFTGISINIGLPEPGRLVIFVNPSKAFVSISNILILLCAIPLLGGSKK